MNIIVFDNSIFHWSIYSLSIYSVDTKIFNSSFMRIGIETNQKPEWQDKGSSYNKLPDFSILSLTPLRSYCSPSYRSVPYIHIDLDLCTTVGSHLMGTYW